MFFKRCLNFLNCCKNKRGKSRDSEKAKNKQGAVVVPV
jgi:hypothetical protein